MPDKQPSVPLIIGIRHKPRSFFVSDLHQPAGWFQLQMAFGAIQWPNMNRQIAGVVDAPRDQAANELVKFALARKSQWLYIQDDDVEVPYYAPRKLIYDLDNADEDVMVAGGIYVTKSDPPEPVVYRDSAPYWRWKAKEVFECDAVGAGCMLIKTEVFLKLKEPWFKVVDSTSENGNPLFIDDDRWFCMKVRESGFKILADGGILCAHHDLTTGRRYVLPPDSYPLRRDTEHQEPGADSKAPDQVIHAQVS